MKSFVVRSLLLVTLVVSSFSGVDARRGGHGGRGGDGREVGRMMRDASEVVVVKLDHI